MANYTSCRKLSWFERYEYHTPLKHVQIFHKVIFKIQRPLISQSNEYRDKLQAVQVRWKDLTSLEINQMNAFVINWRLSILQ